MFFYRGSVSQKQTSSWQMPRTLRFLCWSYVAILISKTGLLGYGLITAPENEPSVVWASAMVFVLTFVLLAVLIGFMKRNRRSLDWLVAALVGTLITSVAFEFIGTPFIDASSLLRMQKICGWIELSICLCLLIALRRHSTRTWLSSRP